MRFSSILLFVFTIPFLFGQTNDAFVYLSQLVDANGLSRANEKFSTPNCNRDEKPKRVARELQLDTYGQISYFGDSKGDFAMKAIVTNFHYRIFDE